jgi:hypothetical protein
VADIDEGKRELDRVKNENARARLANDDLANQRRQIDIELTRMRQRLGG